MWGKLMDFDKARWIWIFSMFRICFDGSGDTGREIGMFWIHFDLHVLTDWDRFIGIYRRVLRLHCR